MTTSLERHPGYFENDPRVDPADIGRGLTFPQFDPYISFDGIDDIHHDAWKIFLSSLFEYTGRLWLPRHCGQAPHIQDYAEALIDKYPQDIPFSSPMTRNYSPGHHAVHYWLEVVYAKDQRTVVIDPFGVHPNLKWDTAHTIPFFGHPQYASPDHQKVYLHTA